MGFRILRKVEEMSKRKTVVAWGGPSRQSVRDLMNVFKNRLDLFGIKIEAMNYKKLYISTPKVHIKFTSSFESVANMQVDEAFGFGDEKTDILRVGGIEGAYKGSLIEYVLNEEKEN